MKDKLKVFLDGEQMLDVTKVTLIGSKKTLDIFAHVQINDVGDIKGRLTAVSDHAMHLVSPKGEPEHSVFLPER